ncbi:hypothetical protein [Deinococcus alpinitundrae]|uniref:hypothetical protein n=1 Tax=Deinococcus alpinitundrae TaxID=468913 RepID=UPI00137A878F|nr:hypothetical protein [Deinococcus alpinitundrae]
MENIKLMNLLSVDEYTVEKLNELQALGVRFEVDETNREVVAKDSRVGRPKEEDHELARQKIEDFRDISIKRESARLFLLNTSRAYFLLQPLIDVAPKET